MLVHGQGARRERGENMKLGSLRGGVLFFGQRDIDGASFPKTMPTLETAATPSVEEGVGRKLRGKGRSL